MSVRALAVGTVASAGLVLAAALFLDLSLARAALLAPVIVVAGGAVAGLVVLWARAGLESLRRARRPRLVAGLVIAGIALLGVLTWLGVELPRE